VSSCQCVCDDHKYLFSAHPSSDTPIHISHINLSILTHTNIPLRVWAAATKSPTETFLSHQLREKQQLLLQLHPVVIQSVSTSSLTVCSDSSDSTHCMIITFMSQRDGSDFLTSRNLQIFEKPNSLWQEIYCVSWLLQLLTNRVFLQYINARWQFVSLSCFELSSGAEYI